MIQKNEKLVSNTQSDKVLKQEFLFSIIIPIYNVEKYIAETIDSVINQTLDFKNHVQLILINDGSPDKSEEVCLPYVAAYPENITYVKKGNGGVSSARNLGLTYARGEYVNFLDSDDKLELNVLEEVYDFFTKNKNEIDLVAIPLYFFDAQTGSHILNYKFKKTGIIDLFQNPNYIQLSSSSCFIKRDVATKYTIDEQLKYAEDAKYISQIVLEKMKYGVLSNVGYLYRRRQDGSSAIQKGPSVKAWYLDYITYFSEFLIDYSLKRFNEVPLYIQHLIMYDLQWRFKVPKLEEHVLSEDEKRVYIKKIVGILSFIDNKVIFAQRYMSFHLKVYVAKLKYSNTNQSIISYVKVDNDVKVYLDEIYLGKLSKEKVQIDLIEVKGNEVTVEGYFAGSFPTEDIELKILLNDKQMQIQKVNRFHQESKFMGQTVKAFYGFKTVICIDDVKQDNQIYFKAKYDDVEVALDYDLRKDTKFSKIMPSYYAKDKLLLHPVKNYINVVPNTFFKHLKKELGMFKRLFMKNDKYALQAIAVRSAYYVYKFFNRQPIYLYMDRVFKAGDNAERLFEYSVKQNDNVKKFFIISKSAPEYAEISKKGNVILHGSRKHRFYMLLADKFISSHADDLLMNPFGPNGLAHYKDLMDYEFVFLQHGVIIHDLSAWLNKYQKNIKLFVTTAQDEYNSIINGNYGYSEKEVKLVGLPRFDLLESKPEKKILIMPTWRKELAGTINPLTLERAYNKEFKNSLYYKSINDLLNDKKILEVAKKRGYKIVFYPHPNIMNQLCDFDIPLDIEVANNGSEYREHFNKSDLLITDYSSVAYDFAYLKKPVIYYHFEKIHWEMGYFNYKSMSFGEVQTTHEGMVNKIVHYMENNFEMESHFKERVDQFYKYTDKENTKRVYEEINKI